jgi:Flp pilus assembly protein CpaB
MSMKRLIIVCALIVAVATIAQQLYFSATKTPQAVTAVEKCVEKHLDVVPFYERLGASNHVVQLCQEQLRN